MTHLTAPSPALAARSATSHVALLGRERLEQLENITLQTRIAAQKGEQRGVADSHGAGEEKPSEVEADVLKRLEEGQRHDKSALNDILRDHGQAV